MRRRGNGAERDERGKGEGGGRAGMKAQEIGRVEKNRWKKEQKESKGHYYEEHLTLFKQLSLKIALLMRQDRVGK